MRQTRQAVRAINQSIFIRCLWCVLIKLTLYAHHSVKLAPNLRILIILARQKHSSLFPLTDNGEQKYFITMTNKLESLFFNSRGTMQVKQRHLLFAFLIYQFLSRETVMKPSVKNLVFNFQLNS
jgi:hypothetical protein